MRPELEILFLPVLAKEKKNQVRRILVICYTLSRMVLNDGKEDS